MTPTSASHAEGTTDCMVHPASGYRFTTLFMLNVAKETKAALEAMFKNHLDVQTANMVHLKVDTALDIICTVYEHM